MKNNRRETGITLIALVITIIILLILAGISIQAITNTGLFENAEKAENEYSEKAAEERLKLELSSLSIDKLTNLEYNEDEYLTNSLQKQGFIVTGNIVIVDGWQFQIDRSVPQIENSLGKGTESNKIEIATTIEYVDNFSKAIINVNITSENEIAKILFNGENIDYNKKEDRIYTISKEVTNNGKYNIYVKDISEQYKVANVNVTEIPADTEISSVEGLVALRDKVNKGANYEGKTITLTQDLDLSSVCGETLGSWTPIGNETNKYKGTFNGNGHTISNIYVNSTLENQGLFGCTDTSAYIYDVRVSGNITSTKKRTGGLIGINYGKIEKCINYTKVTGSVSKTGGIAGRNAGVISRCVNYGDVKGQESVGGISGMNGVLDTTGYIYECYNMGNVYSTSYNAGGIVGILPELMVPIVLHLYIIVIMQEI